jgi:hypothetical protein
MTNVKSIINNNNTEITNLPENCKKVNYSIKK